jgi:hypothetical protein
MHHQPTNEPTSQNKVGKAEKVAISDLGFWRILLLAKYFANSEFLRVCGANFAILTQNSSKSILQCTIYIRQHIETFLNIFHGNLTCNQQELLWGTKVLIITKLTQIMFSC